MEALVTRKNARMATFSKWLIRLMPIGVILLAPACLESKPKVLGNSKLSVTAVDTATPETFKFNFGYRDPSVVANPTVYLQGVANSNSVMTSTCNAAGTGCQCEFMQTTAGVDTVISGVTATSAYDTVGNFFTCTYNTGVAALGILTKVRLRNLSGSKISDAVTVDTSITPRTLVGPNLDVNKVRTVYRYPCQFNYLEKRASAGVPGAAPGTFNCLDSTSFCETASNFCFVQVKYPFYVFRDGYTTNMFKQMVDRIYNAGGTNVICNRQIKQFDCNVGTTGEILTKKFGLYADQSGNFQTPVLLTPQPGESTDLVGYAAKIGLSGNCPPGMVKKVFYNAAIPAVTDSTLAGDTAVEIGDPAPAAAPSAVAVNRQYGDGVDPLLGGGGTGGKCNGTDCFYPRGPIVAADPGAPTVSYSATGSQFCVIDPTILP